MRAGTSTNINNFKRSLRSAADLIERNSLKIQQEVTVLIMSELIVETPKVTTLTVSNWQIGSNSAPRGIRRIRSPGGIINEARGVVRGARRGVKFYIVNNVPWLRRLNTGWSVQRPPGWIERAIFRARNQVRSVVRLDKK